MTTLTVRPLRPALSLPPTFCQNKTSPTKLSLLIPSCTEESSSDIAASPLCRTTCTPVALKKPKLSLSFGETKRAFSTSGSSSSSRLSVCTSTSPSDDESNTSQEDITSRNTVVNTHIGASASDLEGSLRWTRSYSFTAVSGKRSILKGSPSCSGAISVTKRGVSFQEGHTVIPFPTCDEDKYDVAANTSRLHDIESMSPPSTTSSTDSEESESDSEPKTPVDDDEDCRGRAFDRWPASGASRSGKWRRPKREWVWTLGGSDSNDIMQELEYSSASLMQVEAI